MRSNSNSNSNSGSNSKVNSAGFLRASPSSTNSQNKTSNPGGGTINIQYSLTAKLDPGDTVGDAGMSRIAVRQGNVVVAPVADDTDVLYSAALRAVRDAGLVVEMRSVEVSDMSKVCMCVCVCICMYVCM
jgi:hypothetical protein